MNLYDYDYYERGIETKKSGYTNFRWMPELTVPMCETIIKTLNITDRDNVLDFGCAKGYIVKALRQLGIKAWGVDVSEYAITNSDPDVRPYLYLEEYKLQGGREYDWIISKDVFEHIPYEVIDSVLVKLYATCEKLFCVIPLGDSKKYNIPEYENDTTHIIRESSDWWCDKFVDAGFHIELATNRIDGIKDNYKEYEEGNGFFILYR